MPPTAASFHQRAAQRLHSERRRLCEEWLERLDKLLPVPAREVFPSETLLDHVPDLLAQIARDLEAPEEELAANSLVTEKAHALGALRFEQDATIHQLLREFDLLALVLDEFLVDEAASSPSPPAAAEVLLVQSRLHRAIRLLLQSTIDTFVEHYTQTIEEQRSRLASYNRMVSHELRTPIGTLEMASELLAGEGNPEEQKRLGDVLRRNAIRARQILEGLDQMDQTSPAPTPTPNLQVVDLSSLASDVSQRLSDVARERGVRIEIEAGLPKIECDVAKLEMVLRNLISNGIKYSDPARSERMIRIEVSAATSGDDELEIAVSDNGVGIPADRVERVFERFERAHAESDELLGVDGHGLGLAIVRDCIEALGGRVELESEVGRGSTFRLRLPRKPNGRSTT